MTETDIDKAKEGGNASDEKKVVAGGIAITVVIILMIGWAVIFLHKIQSGSQQIQLNSGMNQELQDLRNQAGSGQTQTQQQVMQVSDTGSDQFTNPTPTP